MKIKKNICGNKRVGILSTALWSCFSAAFLNAGSLTSDRTGWRPGPESPAVFRDARSLVFPCVFSEGLDRVYWDCTLSEDWSDRDGIEITYRLENLRALRAVTLYMESDKGWYSTDLPMKEGVHTAFLFFRDFERTDAPGGFDTIERIRISPWKGGEGEGVFRLYDFAVVQSPVLLVDPDEATSLNPSEHAFGMKQSAWLAEQFRELGVPVMRMSDADASASRLGKFDGVVLPYNAYPSPSLLRALDSYLQNGGKLLVFYSASPELAEMSGFKLQRYLHADSDQKWNTVAFVDERWQGPERVPMPARNILPVIPGEKAEVLADWVDRRGRRQKEPAILLSDRAIWVTAVLPADEGVKQKQMLAGLADRLWPELQMSSTAVRRLMLNFREEHPPGDPPENIERVLAEAEAYLQSNQPFAAWNLLNEWRRKRQLEVAGNFDAPEFEMRGIWDATGQGLVPGNWEKTVQVLEEAGITDLFVYVPGNRGNPIRVLQAAEGKITVHAWHICWNLTGQSPVTLRRYEREGRLQISEEGEVMPWLCPSRPENVEAEIRRIRELAGTKGIGGVHLDYVRWQDDQPCACDSCKKSFQKAIGKKADWPGALREGPQNSEFLEWRALQIDHFVKKVSVVMKEMKPEILFSVAVWPSPEVALNRIGQNWTTWVKKGWLDFIVVMNYTENVQDFKQWITEQRRLVGHSARLMTGIGVDSSESHLSPLQVLNQLRLASGAGADGFVLFQLNPSFAEELAPVLHKLYRPREKK